MASLFDVNENGEIIYDDVNGADGSASPEEGLPDEGAADPEVNIPEGEVVEGGIDDNQVIDSGTDVSSPLENPANVTQITETVLFPTDDSGSVPVVLSDEIQELLVKALSPDTTLSK